MGRSWVQVGMPARLERITMGGVLAAERQGVACIGRLTRLKGSIPRIGWYSDRRSTTCGHPEYQWRNQCVHPGPGDTTLLLATDELIHLPCRQGIRDLDAPLVSSGS